MTSASGYPIGQAAYDPYVQQAATYYGVPYDILSAQIQQESSYNPDAQNGNATGLGQFMPATASQYGIDPTNPYQSIAGTAAYDSDLYNQTGSWSSALTSYGTLPSDSSSYTASQANLASLASSYDQSSGLAQQPSGEDPDTITIAPSSSNTTTNPASGSAGALGSVLGNLGAVGSLFGGGSGAGTATNFFVRVVCVVLGIAITVVGVNMLKGVQNITVGAAKAIAS